MTNEQAIKLLDRRSTIPDDDASWEEIMQAIDMAIEALKREEELTEYMRGYLAGCNDTSNKLKELSNLSIRI